METTPTPELVALLACPFCGGEAKTWTCMDESLWSHNIVPWTRVGCTECPAEIPSTCEGSDPDAITAWNTRAATVPQGVLDSARLDALETEISEGGPIVLHNGEGTGGKHRGLGMANTGRTLRQAIDEMCDLNAAITPPPAELGKGS